MSAGSLGGVEYGEWAALRLASKQKPPTVEPEVPDIKVHMESGNRRRATVQVDVLLSSADVAEDATMAAFVRAASALSARMATGGGAHPDDALPVTPRFVPRLALHRMAERGEGQEWVGSESGAASVPAASSRRQGLPTPKLPLGSNAASARRPPSAARRPVDTPAGSRGHGSSNSRQMPPLLRSDTPAGVAATLRATGSLQPRTPRPPRAVSAGRRAPASPDRLRAKPRAESARPRATSVDRATPSEARGASVYMRAARAGERSASALRSRCEAMEVGPAVGRYPQAQAVDPRTATDRRRLWSAPPTARNGAATDRSGGPQRLATPLRAPLSARPSVPSRVYEPRTPRPDAGPPPATKLVHAYNRAKGRVEEVRVPIGRRSEAEQVAYMRRLAERCEAREAAKQARLAERYCAPMTRPAKKIHDVQSMVDHLCALKRLSRGQSSQG